MQTQSQLSPKDINEDSYLKFLETLVRTKQIQERTKLNYFYNNLEVESKNIIRRIIQEEFAVVAYELENKKILLVEDIPLNFLISHSIFVGDETEIVEATLIDDNKTYLLEKSLFKTYGKKFLKNSIRKVNPKELFNLKLTKIPIRPSILEDLINYTLNIKKVDLNKIHIIKGNKIENFIPTIKSEHFNIAIKMGLPLLRPLIDKNFIKESTINIKDSNLIKKQLKILFLREKNIKREFHKESKEKLYRDISTQIIIKPDFELLSQKIDSLEICYPKKETLKKFIKNTQEIIMSQKEGEIIIPLWKSRKTQQFLPIHDKKEFLDITGINFKLDNKLLKELYIQNLEGDKEYFSIFYLKKKFYEYVNKDYSNDLFLFSTREDFILQLIQNKKPTIVIKKDELSKNQILQFKKKIKSLTKLLILRSIKENKIPKTTNKQDFLSKFYLNCIGKNLRLTNEFSNYPSQKKLLKEGLKTLNSVFLSCKKWGFNLLNFQVLSKFVISSLELFDNIDKKFSTSLREIFLSYFKELKEIQVEKIKENIDLTKLFENLIQLNSLSGKEELYITNISKVEEFIPNSVQYFNSKLGYEKHFSPNTFEIKKDFPEGYENIIKKIKNLSVKEIEKIIDKNSRLEIKKKYIKIYKKYNNYTLVQENTYYSLYRIRRCN